MKLRLLRLFAFTLMLGVLVLTACTTLSGKPTVVIASPPSGSQYHDGDDVAIQSTSGDATGVVRVELNVDGSVVRNDTPPSPQTNFSIIQTWKATQGSHAIVVRAYNAAGVSSDPAAISIQVNPAIALNNPSPTATVASSAPSPTPTNTPDLPPAPPGAPSSTPTTGAPPPPPPCTNNAAFVADVTIPDGFVLAAGQAFNKTWQLKNTGTCVWGVGYQLVFVSGEAMTGSTATAVPATAAGATVNVIVPMTAPGTAGNHSGTWRMRSADGAIFGQSFTVKISVPGAPPAPPAGCSGTPAIASFTVSAPSVAEATTINVLVGATVTLHWGAVTNADSVEIDHGIGGVPAPGTTTDTPGATTSYVITAHCSGNSTTAHVTVNVVTLPPPVFLYDFNGDWKINYGTLHINQSSGTASGSFNNGSTTCNITGGTISGATLDAGYNCGIFIAGNTIHLTGTDTNHIDGTMRTTKLCGARNGVTFAAGCGFAGHWNINTNGSTQTADITQTGNSVAGTYGPGGTGRSIEGTVTGWTLTGTWHIGTSNGPFTWVIAENDLTFKGHYGTSFWCGWRDGQAAIPNGSCHD